MATSSTRISCHLNAPRAKVYRALLDAQAVTTWMVPTGMTSHVHLLDAREGGLFRISLTYDAPTGTGKTTAHTDTYHGHFVKLVPNEQVVEVMEFETADAALRGEMTVTYTLTDAGGGTDLLAVHDNVPPGVSPADNETGVRHELGGAGQSQASRSASIFARSNPTTTLAPMTMTGTVREPLRANISRKLAKLPTTFLASNSTPLDERYAFATPQGPQVGVV